MTFDLSLTFYEAAIAFGLPALAIAAFCGFALLISRLFYRKPIKWEAPDDYPHENVKGDE